MLGGHLELLGLKPERLLHGGHHALIGGHPADEEGGRLDLLALGYGPLEIAGNRDAEALHDLGRCGPLLLGVDHVRFREDGAAPRDARRSRGREGNASHVLDPKAQARCLLVYEGAGPCGAIAVGAVIHDAQDFRALFGIQPYVL